MTTEQRQYDPVTYRRMYAPRVEGMAAREARAVKPELLMRGKLIQKQLEAQA